MAGNKKNHKLETTLAPAYPSDLIDEVEALAGHFLESWRPFTFGDELTPISEVDEQNGELVIRTRLPGFNKEDCEVSIEGDRLTISAERKEKTAGKKDQQGKVTYYGHYSQAMTLPFPVKANKARANFNDGVLEVRLPGVKAKGIKKVARDGPASVEKQRRMGKNGKKS